MINHLTNQHGKVFKLGGKANKLEKILATITSNLVQSLTLQQTCLQHKVKATTSSLVLVLLFTDAVADAAKEHEDVKLCNY